jgi:beta-glucosidase/6-phospho-beta-glucosidase/beta-galactosidase
MLMQIWDKFCDAGIEDGSHVKRTCGHLDRYKEDVARECCISPRVDVPVMAKLGINSYRFSISWPRVIPKGGRNDPVNELGLQFYDDLIDELLKHNITPFVTLYQ